MTWCPETSSSCLTGESDAVGRTGEPVAAGPVLQARNCVMGTDVVAGSAKAMVFATGAATEFGGIFRLAAAAPWQKTPLQRQVALMARRVAGTALAIGAALFAVRVPTGQPFVETFVFALGVMVALVPEGLPRRCRCLWRSACGAWPGGTRWSSSCWRWRRSAPPPSCARTRPGRSPRRR
ncbi:hypothetical protein [Streptomyces milbemycinicus]|uniref:P-type ATPase n=1 Tax=Streptomyces milbemycinicus TaxID=476552 RepID=UPI0033CEAB05